METELPHSPSLLASCEIADSPPNQTICPTRNCWHVLTEISSQPGTDFSHRGKRVHRTQYTYTVQAFSWLLLSFAAESSASGPQSGKAPYHSLPLPPLFYLYIRFFRPTGKRIHTGLTQDSLMLFYTWTASLGLTYTIIRSSPPQAPPHLWDGSYGDESFKGRIAQGTYSMIPERTHGDGTYGDASSRHPV
jgi:hypothetical protein